MNESQKRLCIVCIAFVLCCFTILKPVHIDEANFLMLTQGSFLYPHNVLVNWQGTTERAFDVLSNPAGIAWILWPYKDLDPMWMRLSMFPWFLLLLYGTEKLGQFFGDSRLIFVYLTLFSPVVVLHMCSLTPDIPLVATYIAGISGVCLSRDWRWALLAGCSVFFRYSGLTVIPLIFGWGLIFGHIRTGIKLSLVACIPFVLLTCHDLWAYGQSHFLHMISFQSAESSPMILKLMSIFAMLSGAVVLPLFSIGRHEVISFVLSIGFAMGIASLTNQVSDLFWVFSGSCLFLNSVRFENKKSVFLSIWIVGGLFFLSQLRFTAARYWLPFFFPVLLVVIQDKKFRAKLVLLCTTSILSIFLLIDDYYFAVAHRDAAIRVQEKYESGIFAGHWGWQHYLQNEKWIAAEDDMTLPKDTIFASINTAWPQEVQGCTILLEKFSSPSFWGPRVHTSQGMANIHSSHIHDLGMVFSPWSFGRDPYVHVELFQSCP